MGAKITYVKLNTQMPSPPRGTVPVNQGRTWEALSLCSFRVGLAATTQALCSSSTERNRACSGVEIHRWLLPAAFAAAHRARAASAIRFRPAALILRLPEAGLFSTAAEVLPFPAFAQRARWEAAIRSRASGLIVLFPPRRLPPPPPWPNENFPSTRPNLGFFP